MPKLQLIKREQGRERLPAFFGDDMEYGTYINTIHCYECPYCNQLCSIDNGDETDLSQCDEEDHECEHCRRTFSLMPGD